MTDWLAVVWAWLIAVARWLASGLVGVIEYHAEPVVQARWRVTW